MGMQNRISFCRWFFADFPAFFVDQQERRGLEKWGESEQEVMNELSGKYLEMYIFLEENRNCRGGGGLCFFRQMDD